MSENFTKTELLIQYLDGELNEAQQAALNKSMEEDPTFGEELERLQLAREAVKSYGLKNKISAVHADMMQEMKENAGSKTGIVRTLFQYGTRVAAALLILTGLSLSYQYFTTSPAKLFDENFEAFNLHETRGNVASPLEEAYKKENMQAVILQFDTLKDKQPQDYFITANAFLSTRQPAKAIAAFEALQLKNKTNNTHFFEEDTEYYLALSYLLNNEPAKAIPILEAISADKAHPYHKKITAWFMRKVHHLGLAK